MTLTRGDTSRPVAPAELLADYDPGDFLLATAARTIHARGDWQEVPGDVPERLATHAAEARSGADAELIAGILPFDSADPAHLLVPNRVRTAGSLHPALAGRTRGVLPAPRTVRSVPEAEEHLRVVGRGIDALRAGELRKVVLARALEMTFDERIDARTVLGNLAMDNPEGFTFGTALPGGRSLVGATPELLLRRTGRQVISRPYAGSAARSADPVIDADNGRALAASKKDQAEHAVVVEAVVETLRPFCRNLDVPDAPSLVRAPAVWQLSTTVTGELVDPDVDAMHLVAALHPTPAVCGTPRDTARALVRDSEPFDRGYYAGALGWVDGRGDGEWAVAIRCAELADSSMRLFAGGGIMPDSVPADELAETSAKFQVLLRAMGLRLER